MHADEFTNLIKHASAQGADVTPFRYGHIASYDPMQHRVRCVVPSLTDQDGNPLLSPWMPMGTQSSGSGFGVQVIYQGGASITNPTAGEQVMIAIFDRQRGVAAVPCLFYHSTTPPPATNLPTMDDGYSAAADTSAAGDLIISAPPPSANAPNTFLRLRKNGQIQIWAAGQVTADIIGGLTANVNTSDATITVLEGNVAVTATQGNVSVTATAGNATVTAPAGNVSVLAKSITLAQSASQAVLALCTDAFRTLFNGHTHPNSGPPSPQAGPATVTSTVSAS